MNYSFIFKKVLASLLVLLFYSVQSFSQLTPYQKKVIEIQRNYLRVLGVNETYIKQANTKEEFQFLVSSAMRTKTLSDREAFALQLLFASKVKDASNLKNAIDYKRENYEKQQIESDRLANLEREQKKEKEEQKKKELEQIERQKKEHYNNSDFLAIKREIFSNFSHWLVKSEFEKEENYLFRVKTSNHVFDSICLDAVQNRLNLYENNDDASALLLSYNAEKEFFPVQLKFNDIKWTDTIPIALKYAPIFKDNFRNYKIENTGLDWAFYNNNLYPLSFQIKNTSNQELEFKIPIPSPSSIYISPGDVGIHNTELKDFKFNFKEEVKQRKIDEEREENRITEMEEAEDKRIEDLKKRKDKQADEEYEARKKKIRSDGVKKNKNDGRIR